MLLGNRYLLKLNAFTAQMWLLSDHSASSRPSWFISSEWDCHTIIFIWTASDLYELISMQIFFSSASLEYPHFYIVNFNRYKRLMKPRESLEWRRFDWYKFPQCQWSFCCKETSIWSMSASLSMLFYIRKTFQFSLSQRLYSQKNSGPEPIPLSSSA